MFMVLRFTVLASGSGGNASLVETENFGLLIDAGLGPRQLAQRLARVGADWSAVRAVLLTHTHSDHWRDLTLSHLLRRQAPLWCHAHHHRGLLSYGSAFREMHAAGLVHTYNEIEPFEPAPGLRCRALSVRHDGGPTFGFRIEAVGDLFGQAPRLAYAADLGTWDEALVAQLSDVDLLALEFNHDVELEAASGRTPRLIARVLGDDGHLSNDQAAALLRRVLSRSTAGRLRHLVQLHLSRECNRPEIAREAALSVLAELAPDAVLHTAEQDVPGLTLHLGGAVPARKRRARSAARQTLPSAFTQQFLPGLDA
jgi:phosphoribosyl 1,2-cyclic phosphodiesterase